MEYNADGSYKTYSKDDYVPATSGSGSIARYTASSNHNIYADSKGTYVNSNDLGKWIVDKNLSMKSVPNSILAEQTSTTATITQLLSYDNKIVKDGTRYYRLKVVKEDSPEFEYTQADYPVLGTNLDEFITSWNNGHGNFDPHFAKAAKPMSLSAVFEGVRVTPELINQEDVSVHISTYAKRPHLNDGPYDMFCMPYGSINLSRAGVTTNKDSAMAIAFYAAADLGKDNLYDIQLLPYCPCPDYISGTNTLDESFGKENFEWNYVKDTQGNVKSIMIWCNNSSGTFNLEEPIEIERPYEISSTTASGPLIATGNILVTMIGTQRQALLTIFSPVFKT